MAVHKFIACGSWDIYYIRAGSPTLTHPCITWTGSTQSVQYVPWFLPFLWLFDMFAKIMFHSINDSTSDGQFDKRWCSPDRQQMFVTRTSYPLMYMSIESNISSSKICVQMCVTIQHDCDNGMSCSVNVVRLMGSLVSVLMQSRQTVRGKY
jgi:hypothetical protein